MYSSLHKTLLLTAQNGLRRREKISPPPRTKKKCVQNVELFGVLVLFELFVQTQNINNVRVN